MQKSFELKDGYKVLFHVVSEDDLHKVKGKTEVSGVEFEAELGDGFHLKQDALDAFDSLDKESAEDLLSGFLKLMKQD